MIFSYIHETFNCTFALQNGTGGISLGLWLYKVYKHHMNDRNNDGK